MNEKKRKTASGGSRRRDGFSLVEMLVYVGILSVILLIVTNTILGITRSYGTLRAARELQSAALTSLDRAVREIRDAESVNVGASALGSHPGRLSLNSTDAGGNPRTVELYLDGATFSLMENGAPAGPLMTSAARVTNLVFRWIAAARSEAVKIELTLAAGEGAASSSARFYATAVLRESY